MKILATRSKGSRQRYVTISFFLLPSPPASVTQFFLGLRDFDWLSVRRYGLCYTDVSCHISENWLKARSHDPILGSKNWTQAFRQSDFKIEMIVIKSVLICWVTENLQFRVKRITRILRKICGRHLSFKKTVRRKQSMFYFYLLFQNYGSVRRKVILLSWFSEPTKIGWCERALRGSKEAKAMKILFHVRKTRLVKLNFQNVKKEIVVLEVVSLSKRRAIVTEQTDSCVTWSRSIYMKGYYDFPRYWILAKWLAVLQPRTQSRL